MSHAFWDMPDEVIFELMDHDFTDPNDQYYSQAAPYKLNQHPTFRKCDRCGVKRLVWLASPHGWRLAYGTGWGNLTGKIHACEHEFQQAD